jgi:hypothetical protein
VAGYFRPDQVGAGQAVKQDRVNAMVAYALAVASEADSYQDRELGPIHLIKYVYLGDLAFAERNEGKPYSETSWRFHKFGPWSVELYQELPQAAEVAGTVARHFHGPYTEDAVRWRLREGANVTDLESRLPAAVARAIKLAVKEHHNDTSALLHYVYRTTPMLTSAPGEALVFQVKEEADEQAPATPGLPEISKTQLRKLKERVRSHLAQEAKKKTVVPKVTYDEDYFEILDLLDREAGDSLEQTEGVLEFSADVWKSEARRGSEVP